LNLSNEIIRLGEYIYRVYDFQDVESLQVGNAYIFGGTFRGCRMRRTEVLPFMGEYHPDVTQPGIYADEDDELHIVHPKTDKEKSLYHLSRVFKITPETINTDLSKYLSEIDVNDLKYTGQVFEPPIKNIDDVGIKAVRLALWLKRIDFNSYRNRFVTPADRANAKKALMKHSTLTFSKLKDYADVFDLNYGVILFDKSDAKDPMFKEKKAIVVFNNQTFPINDENIYTISTIDDVISRRDEDE